MTKAWGSKTQRNVILVSKALHYPPKEVGFRIVTYVQVRYHSWSLH